MSYGLGCIHLSGIECLARIGISPEERLRTQRVLVHVDLSLDLEAAGHSDHLDLTVDYARVIELLREQVAHSEFQLLEALASHLLGFLMGIPRVEMVVLRIDKFPADLSGQVERVSVSLSQSRSS